MEVLNLSCGKLLNRSGWQHACVPMGSHQTRWLRFLSVWQGILEKLPYGGPQTQALPTDDVCVCQQLLSYPPPVSFTLKDLADYALIFSKAFFPYDRANREKRRAEPTRIYQHVMDINAFPENGSNQTRRDGNVYPDVREGLPLCSRRSITQADNTIHTVSNKSFQHRC